MTLREFLQEKCGSEWGSQSRLARATGRSSGTVARWFDGSSSPDMPSCLAIAEELGLDPVEVMRAASVPEKDIERFVRYCPADKPDERSLYGRSHAEVHRQVQQLLNAFEGPVREHTADLVETIADIRERLEVCMKTSKAGGAQLRLDGKTVMQCGSQASDGWKELSEGRLTFAVLEPDNGGWEHFGGMLLKFAELQLKSSGLIR